MDRNTAIKTCRELLDSHGLNDWRGLLTMSEVPFVGKCIPNKKTIILSALAIDVQPDFEVMDTIKHEIAHALTPNDRNHGYEWAKKAEELGARTTPCANYNIPEHVLDAIRSGHHVDMTFDTIQIPKYKVTRLSELCPECLKGGKNVVAKEKFAVDTVDREGNSIKLITLECFHILKKVIPRATPFHEFVSNGWKPEIKACLHKWTKNTCDRCGENRLFDFQVTGCRTAEAGLATQKGFGFFDDMGLGKTNQAIAVSYYGKYKRIMVVTKSAIKFQWFKAYVTWCGPEYLAQIISTSRDFLFPNMKVYIIPYDLIRRFPKEKLHALNIDLVILDECQQIKNVDSTRTQEVRKLISANPECKVLPLSATPWKNRGSEFFPALNIIDPVKFYSNQAFLDNWVEYYWQGAKKKMGGIRNPKKFKEYCQGLFIRREYEEVMEEFPETNRMKLPVQLDALSQTNYEDSESEFVDWYNEFVIGGEEDKVSGIEILAQMARMRHVTGLAKIPATLSFIEEFVEDTDKKLVVFTHHKDVMDLMYRALTDTDKDSNPEWYELALAIQENEIKVMQYGSRHTGKPEGYQIQENFNNWKRCIMIASTLACGEGLNLQTCADSILHERQWNPQNEDQATPGRFRRIGQTSKQINITLPEAEGTIDEDLDIIVSEKRGRYHVVMNKGEVPQWNETDFARALADRIVAKHKAKKEKLGKTTTTNIAAKARVKRQTMFIEEVA